MEGLDDFDFPFGKGAPPKGNHIGKQHLHVLANDRIDEYMAAAADRSRRSMIKDELLNSFRGSFKKRLGENGTRWVTVTDQAAKQQLSKELSEIERQYGLRRLRVLDNGGTEEEFRTQEVTRREHARQEFETKVATRRQRLERLEGTRHEPAAHVQPQKQTMFSDISRREAARRGAARLGNQGGAPQPQDQQPVENARQQDAASLPPGPVEVVNPDDRNVSAGGGGAKDGALGPDDDRKPPARRAPHDLNPVSVLDQNPAVPRTQQEQPQEQPPQPRSHRNPVIPKLLPTSTVPPLEHQYPNVEPTDQLGLGRQQEPINTVARQESAQTLRFQRGFPSLFEAAEATADTFGDVFYEELMFGAPGDALPGLEDTSQQSSSPSTAKESPVAQNPAQRPDNGTVVPPNEAPPQLPFNPAPQRSDRETSQNHPAPMQAHFNGAPPHIHPTAPVHPPAAAPLIPQDLVQPPPPPAQLPPAPIPQHLDRAAPNVPPAPVHQAAAPRIFQAPMPPYVDRAAPQLAPGPMPPHLDREAQQLPPMQPPPVRAPLPPIRQNRVVESVLPPNLPLRACHVESVSLRLQTNPYAGVTLMFADLQCKCDNPDCERAFNVAQEFSRIICCPFCTPQDVPSNQGATTGGAGGGGYESYGGNGSNGNMGGGFHGGFPPPGYRGSSNSFPPSRNGGNYYGAPHYYGRTAVTSSDQSVAIQDGNEGGKSMVKSEDGEPPYSGFVLSLLADAAMIKDKQAKMSLISSLSNAATDQTEQMPCDALAVEKNEQFASTMHQLSSSSTDVLLLDSKVANNHETDVQPMKIDDNASSGSISSLSESSAERNSASHSDSNEVDSAKRRFSDMKLSKIHLDDTAKKLKCQQAVVADVQQQIVSYPSQEYSRDSSGWVEKIMNGGNSRSLSLMDRKFKSIQTLKGHSNSVFCCAMWNDGRHLLSGSHDGTLKVWERQSDGRYHCIQTLKGHSHYVYCCAVWNHGRHLLSGSYDKTLKVWERQSDGQYHCIQTLEGHSSYVNCCAVWNDGRHLLSGSLDKTLKVRERQSDGQYHCIQTLTGHSHYVPCCAVWNDGRHLLSGSGDNTLKVWERQSDGQYHCIQTLKGHSSTVICCAVWNDGRHLLSGSWDNTLKVWERQSDGQYHCIQTLKGHSSDVICCAVWNDGRHLLSGSRDKTLKVWERQSGGQYHCIQTLKGHADFVRCCAFVGDGPQILSGSDDKTLKVWRLELGDEDETANEDTSPNS